MNAVTESHWLHAMVDLETLATCDNAAILEVGVVLFDLESRTMGPELHLRIGLKENAKAFRTIDAETLAWWMSQWRRHDEVPDLDEPGKVLGFETAMEVFMSFWTGHAPRYFWSRGSFDERILGNALEQAGHKRPWNFWCARDQRTLLDWEGVKPSVASHNALEDARGQVSAIFRASNDRIAIGERLAKLQENEKRSARLIELLFNPEYREESAETLRKLFAAEFPARVSDRPSEAGASRSQGAPWSEAQVAKHGSSLVPVDLLQELVGLLVFPPLAGAVEWAERLTGLRARLDRDFPGLLAQVQHGFLSALKRADEGGAA